MKHFIFAIAALATVGVLATATPADAADVVMVMATDMAKVKEKEKADAIVDATIVAIKAKLLWLKCRFVALILGC